MFWDNNADAIVREVKVRLIKAFRAGRLIEAIDRIPVEMRPREMAPTRCCTYKDRAMIRYRIMAALGLGIEDETDELTPLAAYARLALARKHVGTEIVTIIDAACSGCVRAHYQVTDACHGCMARPCTVNCRKKAVVLLDGKARIDQELCVNCGLCQKVCPYHAIVRVPIPCEEACPVEAIKKDESGRERIDFARCIYCGKCVDACPFAAIVERSQLLDVLNAISSRRMVVALPAPAVVGQYPGGLPRIVAALKKVGFAEVVEVALGADDVARSEADEFCQRMAKGEKFMTTSCCPAYVEATRKIVPSVQPFVSHTPSPLQRTAEIVKSRWPDAAAVFVGPCIAKRKESVEATHVDYYLTFEELSALLQADGVDVAKTEPAALSEEAHREGRGFPVSGGVAGAVQALVGERQQVRSVLINGLNRQNLRLLDSYAREGCPGNLVEVMGCEGGCVAGPAIVAQPAQASRKIEDLKRQSAPMGTPPAAKGG